MTVEGWVLVSNVTIIVLLTVGGFWLNTIVKEQRVAKDGTTEALKAQIEGLRGNTLPSVIKDYEVVCQHLDRVTKENQQLISALEAHIKVLSKRQAEYLKLIDEASRRTLAKYEERQRMIEDEKSGS